MKKIIITGSHLTPALALIDKLIEKKWQVTYFGTGKVETKILPKSIVTVKIVSPKLKRYNLKAFLFDIFKLPFGVAQSFYHLLKAKPLLVVSFGGHVALPVCLAAKALGVPIIIHEQTFKAGLTSKITAKLAKVIAVSWEDSANYFPRLKTVLTGNPLRKQILNLKESTSIKRETIYITGGSQGSKIINLTTQKILKNLLKDFRVYHQFGLAQSDIDWNDQLEFLSTIPDNLKRNYTLKRWFDADELTKILSTTDLVISRSGINTITELGFLKIPAILIPLPFTQKNEQLINAKYLEKLGLAKIILQKDLTSKNLLSAIKSGTLKKKPKDFFPTQLVSSATDNLFKLVESTR